MPKRIARVFITWDDDSKAEGEDNETVWADAAQNIILETVSWLSLEFIEWEGEEVPDVNSSL